MSNTGGSTSPGFKLYYRDITIKPAQDTKTSVTE
jgi:hypothetical protein